MSFSSIISYIIFTTIGSIAGFLIAAKQVGRKAVLKNLSSILPIFIAIHLITLSVSFLGIEIFELLLLATTICSIQRTFRYTFVATYSKSNLIRFP
jgi:hypothetical protein